MDDLCSNYGDRLFTELNALLEDNPLIDEIGFIPQVPDVTEIVGTVSAKKKPKHVYPDGLPYYCAENKLGITYWCIPHLYKYVSKMFHTLKSALVPPSSSSRRKHVRIHVATKKMLLLSTRAMLMINADYTTAWNVRKQCFLEDSTQESDFNNELMLITLILSKHPKSGDGFAHRRWILRCMGAFNKENNANVKDMYKSKLFQSEITVCERSCELYPKNYYAWSHRQWLTHQLLELNNDNGHPDSNDILFVLEMELSKTKLWTNTHVSDHCGFHHRQTIMAGFNDSSIDPSFFHVNLLKELAYVVSLIVKYPGHESLWMHRRYLYTTLSKHLPSVKGDNNKDDDVDYDTVNVLAFSIQKLLAMEVRMCNDIYDKYVTVNDGFSSNIDDNQLDKKLQKGRAHGDDEDNCVISKAMTFMLECKYAAVHCIWVMYIFHINGVEKSKVDKAASDYENLHSLKAAIKRAQIASIFSEDGKNSTAAGASGTSGIFEYVTKLVT